MFNLEDFTDEQLITLTKRASIIVFLIWNVGLLILPTVIFSLGGSLLWFLLSIPYMLFRVPNGRVIRDKETGEVELHIDVK